MCHVFTSGRYRVTGVLPALPACPPEPARLLCELTETMRSGPRWQRVPQAGREEGGCQVSHPSGHVTHMFVLLDLFLQRQIAR